MVRFTIISSALLAGFAIAQQPNPSFNSSVVQQVAGEVSATTRSSWCTGQVNSCGILCSGQPSQNGCDPQTLNFTCTCSSNNSAPALQYYAPTMISFICNRALGDCLQNTAGSQSQQQNCKDTIVCGSVNVSALSTSPSGSSSASGAATSGSPSATGSSGSSQATATGSGSPGASPSKSAGDAIKITQELTTGLFGTAMLAVLGFAL